MALPLDVYTNCEKYSTAVFKDIPYLDVTAVLNDSAKVLVINVINKHETKVIPTDIVLQTGTFTGSAKVYEVNGKAITSTNTKTEEVISISTKEVKFKGNAINYSFPAHSLTQLEIGLGSGISLAKPLTQAHDAGTQVADNLPTPGAPNKYYRKPGI